MLNAIILDGPYKGWPLRAAMAISTGASPARVKDGLREMAKPGTDTSWIDDLPDRIELK